MNAQHTFLPVATLCALLAIGSSANAQIAAQRDGLFTGLTVHGHGEVKAKPDIAYSNVTITTQSRDQQQAIADASQKTKDVIDALKASKVMDKDIQTAYYSVQPQYDYQTTPAVLTGYQVTNSLRVTFRDIAKVGVILDKTTRAGATTVEGVEFDLADRNRVEGSALAIAVANARSKADLMAGAAGVELSRIISDSEGSMPAPEPIRYTAMASARVATPTPIQPQLITVTADATVVYSILPGK